MLCRLYLVIINLSITFLQVTDLYVFSPIFTVFSFHGTSLYFDFSNLTLLVATNFYTQTKVKLLCLLYFLLKFSLFLLKIRNL